MLRKSNTKDIGKKRRERAIQGKRQGQVREAREGAAVGGRR